MITQGQVKQQWMGFQTRMAVRVYREMVRRDRKHEPLWVQLIINHCKGRKFPRPKMVR